MSCHCDAGTVAPRDDSHLFYRYYRSSERFPEEMQHGAFLNVMQLTTPRNRFSVLFIDFVRVTNCLIMIIVIIIKVVVL